MAPYLFFIVGACALAVLSMNYASTQDAERARVYYCVIKTASAQHYHGDPASKEAYELFSGSCQK